MENTNALVGNTTQEVNAGFCLSKPGTYVVYIPKGGRLKPDLAGVSGGLSVQWFNPITSGALQTGSVESVQDGYKVDLGILRPKTMRTGGGWFDSFSDGITGWSGFDLVYPDIRSKKKTSNVWTSVTRFLQE